MKIPKLPHLAGGALCLLLVSMIGVKVISKNRDSRIRDITRETTEKIRSMRMQASARAVEDMSGELREHEKALQELHQSRQNGSQATTASSHIPS